MTSLNLLYCVTVFSISALVSLLFQIKQINIVNLLWVNSCLKIRNIREKNYSCGKIHWIDYWKGLTFVFFSHINRGNFYGKGYSISVQIINVKIFPKSIGLEWIFIYFFLFLFYLTLQYCIGFAIYQNESATGIHVFPILSPPPSSLPIPSLWVVPVHQPQASSIVHRTWTGDSFHIWCYTYFNAILPNHPSLSLSHRVQKTVLCISVSFAVSYTGLF